MSAGREAMSRTIRRLLILTLVLAIWEGLYRLRVINPVILGSPSLVVAAAGGLDEPCGSILGFRSRNYISRREAHTLHLVGPCISRLNRLGTS